MVKHIKSPYSKRIGALYSINYREQVIDEIKADPESFGISVVPQRVLLGTYSVSTSSFTWSTNISTASIPNWRDLTSDNFTIEFAATRMSCFDADYDNGALIISYNTWHNYDATTGTLNVGIKAYHYVAESAIIEGTANVYAFY